MKKLLTAVFIIIAIIVTASVFGILHDQVTFTISPEYYTQFKFNQFGLDLYGKDSHRLLVCIVGIMATWWVGLILGIVFSVMSLFLKTPKEMIAISMRAVVITLIITVVTAVIGYFYGRFILINSDNLMNIYDIKDFENYLIVGSIHKYSYAGGGIGLFAGSLYISIKALRC